VDETYHANNLVICLPKTGLIAYFLDCQYMPKVNCDMPT